MTSTSQQYAEWLTQGAALRSAMAAERDEELAAIEEALAAIEKSKARVFVLNANIGELDAKLSPAHREEEAPPTPVSGVVLTVQVAPPATAPTISPTKQPLLYKQPLSATVGDHLLHRDQRLVRVPRHELIRERQNNAEVIHLRNPIQADESDDAPAITLAPVENIDRLTNPELVLLIVKRLGVSTTINILKEAAKIAPERQEQSIRGALSWCKQKSKIDAEPIDAKNLALGYMYSMPKPQLATG